MKNLFILLFGILTLMSSCKNDISKNVEILNTEIRTQTDSIQAKPKNKINRPCEFRTLREIDSLLLRKERLSEQAYLKFIVSIRPDCSKNIEYSQWNNELIFKMLKENPKMFVAFLSRLSRKINNNRTTDFVLEELKSPIHDSIEIDKLKISVRNTQTEDEEIKMWKF